MKTYSIMYNVGKCKYMVMHHDGVKSHQDGSPFYDVALINNKTKLSALIGLLIKSGYQPA